MTGLPVYVGGFREGEYDGEGTLYSPDSGAKIYKGEFLLGKYNGHGILYDKSTGTVIVEGEFIQGKLTYAITEENSDIVEEEDSNG